MESTNLSRSDLDKIHFLMQGVTGRKYYNGLLNFTRTAKRIIHLRMLWVDGVLLQNELDQNLL